MFKKIRDWLFPFAAEIERRVDSFEHPKLGCLRLNNDVGLWETVVVRDGLRITIGIDGDRRPDRQLIDNALLLLNEFPLFKKELDAFLRRESERLAAYYKEEVSGLVIESISLWRRRPGHAMISFMEGKEFRAWRCEYENGEFTDLGFDN